MPVDGLVLTRQRNAAQDLTYYFWCMEFLDSCSVDPSRSKSAVNLHICWGRSRLNRMALQQQWRLFIPPFQCLRVKYIFKSRAIVSTSDIGMKDTRKRWT